eukprot:COSAG06_NODE_239_length_19404_cov_12.723284_14_plen_236_part_00
MQDRGRIRRARARAPSTCLQSPQSSMMDPAPARLAALTRHLQPIAGGRPLAHAQETAGGQPAAARVAVLGAGTWAVSNHLPQLAATPGVEVVALMDASAERCEEVARLFGIPASYSTVEELLAAEQLDGLVVASAHVAHFANALPAVQAGLPCMIEKPMTATAEDARTLVAEAAASGAELLVPCGWNFRPYSERARELVAEGALGEIEHVVRTLTSTRRAAAVEHRAVRTICTLH